MATAQKTETTITAEQFEAIKRKLATGGVLTGQEWSDLASYGTKQADEENKAKALIEDTLKDLRKAQIDPHKLTTILAAEGLIVLPEVKQPEQKVNIFESEKITFPGKTRATSFKFWKGRDVSKETKEVQDRWDTIKAKGKDYFVSRLTAEGKALYNTEDGKKYIDSLFA